MSAKLNVRTLTVEQLPDTSFRGMTETGQVREWEHAADVVAWVRRRDQAAARRGASTATVVEWVGMPASFEVPD